MVVNLAIVAPLVLVNVVKVRIFDIHFLDIDYVSGS